MKPAARLLVALSSVVAIAACASGDGPPDREHLGDISQAGTACPGANTVEGIDVSEWQAGFDFHAAKAQGKQFAIVRVSDGSYLDKSFDTFYPQVKAAGLVRGVYQFFEPSEDPIMQADIVLKRIGGKLEPGDLPPTIDLEVNGDDGSKTKAWLDHIENALGVKPMIYVGYYFWTGNMGNPAGFGGYPLWIAGYVQCPQIPGEWGNWTFWQYSDGGGSLDHDKFNGTLDQLLALAHGQADYAAKFVKQSYPYASQGAVNVTIGDTVKGSITMKNTGKQPWKKGVTKLAPIPRDKASPVAAASWENDHRVSTVDQDTPPGAEGTFEWDLAGNSVGDFDLFWGFVEEGVTWFADPPKGGGPPDNQIEVKVHVTNADYRAEYVKQTYPPSQSGAVMLDIGQTVKGSITMKNVGNQPWKAGVTKLAPIPRDKPSPFASSDWLSNTRVSTLAADVAPGEEGTFELDLTGSLPGDTMAHFGLVEEGVTWFADAPKGGGPPDDFLTVHVVVANAKETGMGGAAGTGGASGAPPHAGSGAMAAAATGDGGASGATSTGAAGASGASTASAGSTSSDAPMAMATGGDESESGGCSTGHGRISGSATFLLALLTLVRRRHARPRGVGALSGTLFP